MSRVDRESEIGDCPSPEVREETVRDLDLGLALATNKVTMCRGREVIGSRPVSEMGVHHDTTALELLEVPVHR